MSTIVQNFRVKPLPSGSIWVGHAKDGSTGFYANKHSSGLNKCPECSRYGLKRIHGPAEAIELYKENFFGSIARDSEYRQTVVKLRGKVLICGCPHKKECELGLCNGKVIAAFLDSLPLPADEEEVIAAARAELSKIAASKDDENPESPERMRKAALDV